MTKILGLDLGTYNVKTHEDLSFKSIYEEAEATDLEQHQYDKVTYEGKTYLIGKGKFDSEHMKTEKKDTLPLFLYALGRSLQPFEKSVKVVCGLPVDEARIKKNKDEIREKFIGRFNFDITINGNTETRFVEVMDVLVFPECIGSYYTITKDLSKKDIILIDIGGSTVNLAYFENGKYIKSRSIPFGTLSVYGAIRDRTKITCQGNKWGIEDIIKYMDRGEIYWKGNTDKMEYVPKIISDFTNDIIKEMKDYDYPYDSSEIIMTGGGVTLFNEELTSRFSTNVEIIADYLFSNAWGFRKVGVRTWQNQ